MLKGKERDELFLRLVSEGRYSVSKEGVIKKHTGKTINGGKAIGNKAEFVVIGKDGNYFSITRNRATWLVYNGLLPVVEGDEYFVSIKDKDKPLHIDNLEIKLRSVISSEVGKRMVTKLQPKASAKMTDEQVLELRREFTANPKAFIVRQRAKLLNLSHATLSFALSGRTYRHVAEPVPKELMSKPGGNMRPRVWDRNKCPSAVNRPRKIRPKKEPAEKTNIVPFKPKVSPTPKPVVKPVSNMTEEQKRARLEMMKNIGKKLNNARSTD